MFYILNGRKPVITVPQCNMLWKGKEPYSHFTGRYPCCQPGEIMTHFVNGNQCKYEGYHREKYQEELHEKHPQAGIAQTYPSSISAFQLHSMQPLTDW